MYIQTQLILVHYQNYCKSYTSLKFETQFMVVGPVVGMLLDIVLFHFFIVSLEIHFWVTDDIYYIRAGLNKRRNWEERELREEGLTLFHLLAKTLT